MPDFKFRSKFDLKESGSKHFKRQEKRISSSRIQDISKRQLLKKSFQNLKVRSQEESFEDAAYESLKEVELEASFNTSKAVQKGLKKSKDAIKRKTQLTGYMKQKLEKLTYRRQGKQLLKNIVFEKRIIMLKGQAVKYLAIIAAFMILFVCLFTSILGGISSEIDMAGGQDNITSSYLYLGLMESKAGRLTTSGMKIHAEPIMAYMIAEFGLQKTFDEKQKQQLTKVYSLINSAGYRSNTDAFFRKYNESVFSSKAKYAAYEKLMSQGIYSEFKTLGSPFLGKDWVSKISSAWGWRDHPKGDGIKLHRGLDIGMPLGTPVNSVCSGKVSSAGWSGGYGNCVKVSYQNGDTNLTILYAHLSSISVRNGMNIKEGAVIGKVGSTGYSTGPHLHIEVMSGSYSSDVTKLFYPRIYLKETKE